jgi:hypothetical protein
MLAFVTPEILEIEAWATPETLEILEVATIVQVPLEVKV